MSKGSKVANIAGHNQQNHKYYGELLRETTCIINRNSIVYVEHQDQMIQQS